MTTKMTASALFFAAALLSTGAIAAQPAGFGEPAAQAASPAERPQGFSAPALTSVAKVKAEAKDHEIVMLRGAFTSLIKHDKYVFTDLEGQTITAELDFDKNWSHVAKDLKMEITAEVDKDWNGTEIEVISAKALK